MNAEDLIHSLEYAAMSYAGSQPERPGERLVALDSRITGVQCCLRLQGDLLHIAFRGTDSPKDWLTDFSFWKKKIPYQNYASRIRVHAGFIDAYKNEGIRGRIHSYLTRDIRRVRLTGHSYGAALAVLCAVDLQYNFPDRDYEVALFGCPRVGNGAFARSYNRRLFKTLRVENGNDIVTRVPPALLGYRHVGIPIRVGPVRLPGAISFLQHRPSDYYKSLWRRT